MTKKPLIIGLTGSIGMGKTTVARFFQREGLAVLSADTVVHALLKKGGRAVPAVAKEFPESLKRGGIDRKILGSLVFGKPERLAKLESLLHPLVWKAEKAFIRQAKQKNKKGVVLEIPLLFETGSEARMDVVVCVTAPLAVQRARVLARPGMTETKWRAIRKKQMASAEKKRRATHVIETGVDLEQTRQAVKKLWKEWQETYA